MNAAKRSTATTEARHSAGHNAGRLVTIVGGGIGGLTAALAFARGGADVTVLEQAAAITEVGAGLQLAPNGAAPLGALGLTNVLHMAGIRAQRVEPTDALTGRTIAQFDLTRLTGQPYRFLHRAELIDILLTAACDAGVTLRTGAKVVGVDAAGAITLAHGAMPQADLTVGADGLHSLMRPALNGEAKAFFTRQVAWRAVIAHDAPPVARIWMAPGRHVVTYPLTRGRLNIVAVREQDDWSPEGWTNTDTPAAFQAAFADLCPDLRALLDKVTDVRLWGLFRHPVAARWHGEACAILGDAAHPTLPFLAQGANLAIEDAYVLATCCDRSADLPAALARYQALRRDRVVRAINGANANAVNYHLAGLRRFASHAALRAVSRVSPGLFLRRMDWLYGHDVTRG